MTSMSRDKARPLPQIFRGARGSPHCSMRLSGMCLLSIRSRTWRVHSSATCRAPYISGLLCLVVDQLLTQAIIGLDHRRGVRRLRFENRRRRTRSSTVSKVTVAKSDQVGGGRLGQTDRESFLLPKTGCGHLSAVGDEPDRVRTAPAGRSR
jgi:hypothetical protein